MSKQLSPFTTTFLAWVDLFMHRSMRGFVRYAREHGFSVSQISALFQIGHRGQLGVSDVGETLGVTNAAASQLIDRLVQQGLLLRSENPQDRREKQLVLTDQGRQVIQDSADSRRQWLERLAATLSPEEQEKVDEALKILIEHINQMPDER